MSGSTQWNCVMTVSHIFPTRAGIHANLLGKKHQAANYFKYTTLWGNTSSMPFDSQPREFGRSALNMSSGVKLSVLRLGKFFEKTEKTYKLMIRGT